MNRYSVSEIDAFLGRLYGGRPLLITPYAYNATFSVAQGASQTQTISIAANADFCMLGVESRFNVGAAQNVSTVTAPLARLLITDTGSNERFTDTTTDLINYSGNPSQSKYLPYPRMIAGRSALQLVLTSYAVTAETYAGDVSLIGVLVRAYAQ